MGGGKTKQLEHVKLADVCFSFILFFENEKIPPFLPFKKAPPSTFSPVN
jgi:hypothetical protein